MKRALARFVIIMACALTILGCKGSGRATASSENNKGNSDTNKSASPSETGLKKESIVIAKVNDRIITSEAVEQEIKNLTALYGKNLPPEQWQELQSNIRNQAIETLINKQVLFLEADRKKIRPSSDEINDELSRIISRFPSPETFYQQLTQKGISEKQILKDIEQQLKINLLLKEPLAGVPAVTDEEMIEFYHKNSENFRAQEQVRARHILLKVDSEASSEIKKQKRRKLADLRSRIADGADFIEMAAKHSECPSSGKGGDLGFFERGQMVKPFDKVAFRLKVGELSKIVETRFGYHLIKIVERKEARALPFEDVREKISIYLKSKKEQLAFNTYLNKLRQSAGIEYIEPNR
jgi:parvulin-like peptidyl-prolyl isomerase